MKNKFVYLVVSAVLMLAVGCGKDEEGSDVVGGSIAGGVKSISCSQVDGNLYTYTFRYDDLRRVVQVVNEGQYSFYSSSSVVSRSSEVDENEDMDIIERFFAPLAMRPSVDSESVATRATSVMEFYYLLTIEYNIDSISVTYSGKEDGVSIGSKTIEYALNSSGYISGYSSVGVNYDQDDAVESNYVKKRDFSYVDGYLSEISYTTTTTAVADGSVDVSTTKCEYVWEGGNMTDLTTTYANTYIVYNEYQNDLSVDLSMALVGVDSATYCFEKGLYGKSSTNMVAGRSVVGSALSDFFTYDYVYEDGVLTSIDMAYDYSITGVTTPNPSYQGTYRFQYYD
ncbi:MAG: hypothetical protein SNH57_06885 [Rikenellaceae bacterium]